MPDIKLPPYYGIELSFTEKFLRHMRAFEIQEAFGELDICIQDHVQKILNPGQNVDRWTKGPPAQKNTLSDREITRAYVSYFQRRIEALLGSKYLQKLSGELGRVIKSEGRENSLLTIDESSFRALNERGTYGEKGLPAIGFNRWKDMQELQGERNRAMFLQDIRNRIDRIISLGGFANDTFQEMIRGKYAHILDSTDHGNGPDGIAMAA